MARPPLDARGAPGVVLSTMVLAHRRARALATCIGSAFAAAACGPAGQAPPARITASIAKEAGRCAPVTGPARVLVAELPAASRVALEAAQKRGLVAVRHDGCGVEVLSDCRVPGTYAYVGTSRQHERVTAKSAEELARALPLAAPSLEPTLARAGEVTLSMTAVGTYSSERTSAHPAELEGACEGATHVVRGMTVGAFQLLAGPVQRTAGGALAGEAIDRGGDEAACLRAPPGRERPPADCTAPLRAELVPIEEGERATKGCRGELAPDGTACIEQDGAGERGIGCRAGTAWNGTTCAPVPKAALAAMRTAHQCKEGEVSDCTTQCSLGHPGSCAVLAWMYEKGISVQLDYVRAAELYERACDGGSARGCNGIGWLNHSGNGVAQNHARAAKLYERACDAGEALACENLGVLYENGHGVPQDYLRAASLFKRACDFGNALGCSAIGNYFVGGWGVAVDRQRGIGLLRRGCAQGDSWGCGKLKEYGETP